MTYTYKALGNFGRLGNQLFQIAGTIGKALDNNAQASFPNWGYQDFFNIPSALFDNRDGNDLSGDYLQDFHHFEKYKDLIKQYFSPSDKAQEIINSFYYSLLEEKKNNHIMAIHVRRGDYLNLSQHHPTCGVDYFETAIQTLSGCIDKPMKKLVFSDDLDWCKKQSVFADALFADSFNIDFDVFDLFTMQLCNSHIISNSTFSWWGAYLAESPLVCYPNPWYGPALQDIDTDNTLILPHWKKIDRNQK
jgi:hypothetical protein